MKKLTSISLLLVLTLAACHRERPKTTYYKSVPSDQIMTQEELNATVKRIKKIFSKDSKYTEIQEIVVDSVVSHDSIIKTIKLKINLSDNTTKPKKEKIYSFLNKKFPSAVLYSIHNRKIDLSKLNGKPTVLNFWFTTCTPCIAEMPTLNKIKKQFNGKVNFIAITYNNKASVEKFLKTHQFDYIQVAGAAKFLKELGMEQYPKNVLIDKNGIVREITGSILTLKNGKIVAGSGKEMEKSIDDLLNNKNRLVVSIKNIKD